MGDTVQEIDSVVQEVGALLPILGGIANVFAPGVGSTVATLGGPLVSILDQVFQSIETLRGSGVSHPAAVAVVGQALTSIGQNLSSMVPPPVAQAAAPVAAVAPPAAHETTS